MALRGRAGGLQRGLPELIRAKDDGYTITSTENTIRRLVSKRSSSARAATPESSK